MRMCEVFFGLLIILSATLGLEDALMRWNVELRWYGYLLYKR